MRLSNLSLAGEGKRKRGKQPLCRGENFIVTSSTLLLPRGSVYQARGSRAGDALPGDGSLTGPTRLSNLSLAGEGKENMNET